MDDSSDSRLDGDAPKRGETSSDEDDGSPSEQPFLVRMLQRASDAFGNGAHEEDEAGHELARALEECSPAEKVMIANILRLRDLRVEDVMTPRADIISVPADAALDDVIGAFERGSLSRLPVYRETLDDPMGFVHLKDLALAYGVGCARPGQDFRLENHVRPMLFVPPSMRIASLLQRMQASRVHMALVIDEFGGVDGLLTIEDLVEQIVGDIEDEHDEEELALWREELPGVWLVSARADIEEFEEQTGVRLQPDDWDEEADTLGGLVFTLTHRVPARGEVVFHPAGHEFEVVDADPRRIKRLRLTLRGSGNGDAAQPREAAE
ncbi:MAG TPA: hemolysin family protein [Thermohalobaculum sp.]|nr:hemolysin family protein [Thermohalobaculum sp.]